MARLKWSTNLDTKSIDAETRLKSIFKGKFGFLNLGQIYLACKFCKNGFELPKFKNLSWSYFRFQNLNLLNLANLKPDYELQNDLNLLSTNFILTLFAKAILACYPF